MITGIQHPGWEGVVFCSFQVVYPGRESLLDRVLGDRCRNFKGSFGILFFLLVQVTTMFA